MEQKMKDLWQYLCALSAEHSGQMRPKHKNSRCNKHLIITLNVTIYCSLCKMKS